MLAASNGKRNVTVWRPSDSPSAHTQRDSPRGSTRRGQRTFPSEYYEDASICCYLDVLSMFLIIKAVTSFDYENLQKKLAFYFKKYSSLQKDKDDS